MQSTSSQVSQSQEQETYILGQKQENEQKIEFKQNQNQKRTQRLKVSKQPLKQYGDLCYSRQIIDMKTLPSQIKHIILSHDPLKLSQNVIRSQQFMRYFKNMQKMYHEKIQIKESQFQLPKQSNQSKRYISFPLNIFYGIQQINFSLLKQLNISIKSCINLQPLNQMNMPLIKSIVIRLHHSVISLKAMAKTNYKNLLYFQVQRQLGDYSKISVQLDLSYINRIKLKNYQMDWKLGKNGNSNNVKRNVPGVMNVFDDDNQSIVWMAKLQVNYLRHKIFGYSIYYNTSRRYRINQMRELRNIRSLRTRESLMRGFHTQQDTDYYFDDDNYN